MKNVNLTGLFLALSSKFGVSSMELHSITPVGNEPIDALMYFNGHGQIEATDLPKILAIVDENIVDRTAIREVGTKVSSKGLEIYIEFVTSEFIDELA